MKSLDQQLLDLLYPFKMESNPEYLQCACDFLLNYEIESYIVCQYQSGHETSIFFGNYHDRFKMIFKLIENMVWGSLSKKKVDGFIYFKNKEDETLFKLSI